MMLSMKCTLCNGKSIIKDKAYQGCIDGYLYTIYECNICGSSFIDPKKVDSSLYDIIYGDNGDGGYNRYYDYALKIKAQSNPLEYLAKMETTYLPVFDYLKKNIGKKLKILEVGCGYGYTTYAIKQMGFDVLGIDISKNAISFARKQFGDNFKAIDIDSVKESFDFILATEVIEHVSNPQVFLSQLKKRLKREGTILITTPNKDYALQVKSDAIWDTILPPHHMLWATSNGIAMLAQQCNMTYTFYNFGHSYGNKENRLNELRRLKNTNTPNPDFHKNGKPILKNKIKLYKKLVLNLLYTEPVLRVTTYLLINVLNYKAYKTNAVYLKAENK